LKIVLSAISQPKSFDFNKILCVDANFGSKNGLRNFANSKWWTAAILKMVFGYIIKFADYQSEYIGTKMKYIYAYKHPAGQTDF